MIRRPPRSTLFPTRRSSDLCATLRTRRVRDRVSEKPILVQADPAGCMDQRQIQTHLFQKRMQVLRLLDVLRLDRKSTRLNSSHGYISYAVFCLKKKKKNKT